MEPIKKVFWILDKQTACMQIGFMVSEENLTVQEKERISRTQPFGKGERVGRSGDTGTQGSTGRHASQFSGTFNKCPQPSIYEKKRFVVTHSFRGFPPWGSGAVAFGPKRSEHMSGGPLRVKPFN